MKHFLSGIDLSSDTPNDFNEIIFGAGCFWGVERKFWSLEGVWLTCVGYAGGNSTNPTYEQVCYEETNHVEVVKVVYDPSVIKIDTLLKTFWECHDPGLADLAGIPRIHCPASRRGAATVSKAPV